MPIIIKGETYYRTSEVCRMANISRSTLLRWTQAGILPEVSHRDRRDWRLFSQEDVNRIEKEAFRLK